MSYKSGTRIRFPREIIEPATKVYSEFLMASAGTEGKIVFYDETYAYPYLIKTDTWPIPFGVEDTEFEVIAADAAGGV